jgi:ADP-ribosylglycohydrolase
MAVINRGENPRIFQEVMGRGGAMPFGMRRGHQEMQPSEQSEQCSELGTLDSSQRDEIPQERSSKMTVHRERNEKLFQQVMGKGGMIMSAPRPVRQDSPDQSHLIPDTPEGTQQMVEQIFQEAREQMSSFDNECFEAFKRGDRIGSHFEGGAMFQPVNEQLLELALKNDQGTDESSIVECFYMFAGWCHYTTKEQFAWEWVSYHEQHHGTGYGRTYKDHFNLVSYIRKHPEKYPNLDSRISKLLEIAKDANSFGNGSLALVYPAFHYAGIVGEEPYEFVEYLTSFTHNHPDAMKAVNLLCSFIENPRTLVEYPVPTEDEIKQLCCSEPHATAHNTLQTAIYIADAGTEMDVIRRGVYVCGDTDSTLATAMLLWSLKR